MKYSNFTKDSRFLVFSQLLLCPCIVVDTKNKQKRPKAFFFFFFQFKDIFLSQVLKTWAILGWITLMATEPEKKDSKLVTWPVTPASM